MQMTTQITTQTPDAANGNIGIIIGGVIGGVAFLAVVFVIVCCVRRKRLLANSRGKLEFNYPNVNPGFEPETNIAMDIMQPIGGMKFPVEMADPRYSLFSEFGSNCSSIKSSQSSKSMLSITSNRSKEQKDEHETVSHMNTPSGLMAFLRQSIFRRRSRSLTTIAYATENHTTNRKSKSLTDLDKDGITKISENVQYRHSAGFPVSNDTIMGNNHIQTHDSADDNRNLHDSGIAETELWTMSSEIHCDVRIHH